MSVIVVERKYLHLHLNAGAVLVDIMKVNSGHESRHDLVEGNIFIKITNDGKKPAVLLRGSGI
jgi:hypothetical protein